MSRFLVGSVLFLVFGLAILVFLITLVCGGRRLQRIIRDDP